MADEPLAQAVPRLTTDRLVLRPFDRSDAAVLEKLAGDRRIADTTISVPHPFTSAHAADWINAGQRGHATGGHRSFAIAERASHVLIGYAGLHDIDAEHRQAEISFWIGGAFEGRGYVTEAARRLIDFAFADLALNRICAFHMVRNAGSQRVLEKLGFAREGYLRERVRKWERYEDVLAWSLLRSDRRP